MKILPIGTVVNLNGVVDMPVMIIGYFPTNDAGESKDYVSVRYPMGAYDNKMYFFFNQEDIQDVLYQGYINDEFTAMSKIIEMHKNENQ